MWFTTTHTTPYTWTYTLLHTYKSKKVFVVYFFFFCSMKEMCDNCQQKLLGFMIYIFCFLSVFSGSLWRFVLFICTLYIQWHTVTETHTHTHSIQIVCVKSILLDFIFLLLFVRSWLWLLFFCAFLYVCFVSCSFGNGNLTQQHIESLAQCVVIKRKEQSAKKKKRAWKKETVE